MPLTDPVERKRYKREYYERNRETVIERAKQWKIDNPERSRYNDRKKQLAQFGMLPEEYDLLLAKQGGCCALCGTTTPGGAGNFHTDHCHETGRVRGLLCCSCNLGVGHYEKWAKDERLMKYLGAV